MINLRSDRLKNLDMVYNLGYIPHIKEIYLPVNIQDMNLKEFFDNYKKRKKDIKIHITDTVFNNLSQESKDAIEGCLIFND